MGWYLFLWAVFSLGLRVASFVAPRFLTLALALTVVLLGLLAIANWVGNSSITRIAGWEGILLGASAMYLAFAFVLNEMFGRTVLPIGGPLVRPAIV
jgi:succinate-acetate transporter protein